MRGPSLSVKSCERLNIDVVSSTSKAQLFADGLHNRVLCVVYVQYESRVAPPLFLFTFLLEAFL